MSKSEIRRVLAITREMTDDPKVGYCLIPASIAHELEKRKLIRILAPSPYGEVRATITAAGRRWEQANRIGTDDVAYKKNDAYSPFADHLRGGRADGKGPEDFDPDQLARGIEHELEHTHDRSIAQEIAMDHLAEDADYYDKLDAMEFKTNPGDGTIRSFDTILTGLLTQYDQAEMTREERRGGRGNIYRIGHLLKASQEARDDVAGMLDRSDAEAIATYRAALQDHFIFEAQRRGGEPEFALAPLRKLDKMMREWVEQGKRPKYPVSARGHTPNETDTVADAGTANKLYRKYVGSGAVDIERLYSVIQRERQAAERGRIRVSPGLLTELRRDQATVGGMRNRMTPNGGYYVWPVAPDGITPLSGEGPHGPYDLWTAQQYARISATEGRHDRAVSYGLDPRGSSFRISQIYRARTGEPAITADY